VRVAGGEVRRAEIHWYEAWDWPRTTQNQEILRTSHDHA